MAELTAIDTSGVTRVELGCGSHKRAGFFGVDFAPGPAVDLVLDIERERLPFEDNSVDHVYSSHTFEHLIAPGSPIQTLKEIRRITRHGGLVEIWTPFGRSDDGLLFGHVVFYTETHWKHICYLYDDFYLGEGSVGRFNWIRTQYVVNTAILERLDALHLPVDFALTHMQNIVLEFGVFLEVDKTRTKAESPQVPERELCYERGVVARRLDPAGVDILHGPTTRSVPSEQGRRDIAQRVAPLWRQIREPVSKILQRGTGRGPAR